MSQTNWLSVYRRKRDEYQSRGEATFMRLAAEDTAELMAREEDMTLLQAREHLNQLVPSLNAMNA